MAEAVAEKPQATEQPTNGTADKTAEVAAEKPKVSAEEKKADENDEHEQYSADKRDDRNKERGDFRKHDRNYDDRRDRDRRDGGRGRGRGRGRGGDRGRGGRGGGRGRGGFRGGYRQDNIRTDYRRLEETDDATEIRRQVEFYFSDSNLPIDKFLLQQTGGHENSPVPLKTIHNFKRMQHFQPYGAVVEAVKNSNFLALTDDEEVYRRRPLDEKFTLDPYENEKLLTSQSMLRSIYAKGFGEESATTQFDIEEYFSPYGSAGVRLRRQKDGTFKGSVFAEFESEEAAQQFLEMENKPAYGPDEKELTFKSKKEYVDGKTDDILEGRVKPNSPTRRYSHHHRNDRQYSNGHGRRSSPDYGFKRKRDGDDEGLDGDDWRARRDRFQSDRRSRDDSRSRSRSPYHERRRSRSPFRHPKNEKEGKAGDQQKKDAPAAEEAKAEQARSEETKAAPADEAKAEEGKTEAKEVEASA